MGKLINSIKRNNTKILTAIEIGATVYAVYRAFKDGPRFKQRLEELNEAGASFGEKVLGLAPIAAPAVISAGASVVTAIINEKSTSEKVAKLTTSVESITTAYNISQNVNRRIEEKARTMIGDEAVDNIQRAAISDKIRSDVSSGGVQIISTGHGNDLFYDDWSGRYFQSDVNFVKKVVNDCNFQLTNELQISLNEFYADLGLPTIGGGEATGWNTDFGLIDIRFISDLDELDRAYTVIKFINQPISLRTLGRW